MQRRWLWILYLVAACGSSPRAPSEPQGRGSAAGEAASPLADAAVSGVKNEALRQLLADHWEHSMRTSPVWATSVGDHRFDDELADNSAAAVTEDRAARDRFLERARAIDAATLSPSDAEHHAMLSQSLAWDAQTDVCEAHLWLVSAKSNPLVELGMLPRMHPLATAADGDNLIARYRKIPKFIDDHIANLRAGKDSGRIGNRESLRRTAKLVEVQLAQPLDEWTLLEAVERASSEWPAEARQRFARELRQVVDSQVRPAYAAYGRFIEEELIDAARDSVGVSEVPNGEACYQARIQRYLGLPKTARELHALGLAEIARTDAELKVLGKRLLGTADLDQILQRLRTDSSLMYQTEAEMIADAEEAVADAREAIPRYFGILPQAPVVVVPVPAHEAQFSTIAYYQRPSGDGTKPGEYFLNVHAPTTRPRFAMRVLSFHEAIPGHHLQIAIAQEREELPAFRRFEAPTVFVEGWGLYTERLADEMGLYPTDLDRMGMVSYDAWRAARLVVDTGMHAMGWTREQAEQFMREHAAAEESNVVNEIDRYIGWPGQALAYKVGQLEILRLREWARSELGEAFDLRAFHDRVLGSGGVTLPVLAANIEVWVAAEKAARVSAPGASSVSSSPSEQRAATAPE